MGILRTNKISGLETPTPVTGSVSFDGSGDYLTLASSSDFAFGTGDFTIEFWMRRTDTGNNVGLLDNRSSVGDSNGWFIRFNSSNTIQILENNNVYTTSTFGPDWSHVAFVRRSGVITSYINGIATATANVTKNYTSTSLLLGGFVDSQSSPFAYQGNISNLRILKGTALYTSNFTPSVNELQRIGDTVLLCCNNPDSAGAEATGKTITVNGNAAASTFSPGLTRDFTYGTQFSGVTKFDTQGYFVPPSGTTEQRSRGRGVFGGGYNVINTLEYINIQSMGNSLDFGDLSQSRRGFAGGSSSIRGVFAGGASPAPTNTNIIDYITISTTSNATDFGDLISARTSLAGCSSNTRGVFAGGYVSNIIDYVTIASIGNAIDFGDLTQARITLAGCSSPTRGIFGGGRVPTDVNTIDYITIASTGNAQDFGDLTQARQTLASCSSNTRGLFAGGGSPTLNTIDYVTIASIGNAVDFGDLTSLVGTHGSCSNSIRGVFIGGATPGATNTIQFVIISSTGNAQDFGDMLEAKSIISALSDSHGGLQ